MNSSQLIALLAAAGAVGFILTRRRPPPAAPFVPDNTGLVDRAPADARENSASGSVFDGGGLRTGAPPERRGDQRRRRAGIATSVIGDVFSSIGRNITSNPPTTPKPV